MPYTMTHLIIAKNIADRYAGQIGSLPQFYLGAIAPDAVHNRAGYITEHKKASHLISGDEKWGFTTKNDEWAENISAFLREHARSKNCDFIRGYCCHALADVYNNEHEWTPFRLRYGVHYDDYAKASHVGEARAGYGKIYNHECNQIDILLAQTYEGRDDFWLHLANAKSLNLPGIIYADEIEQQRRYILNVWYADKERPDISAHTLRTWAGEMAFIKNATDYVLGVLRGNGGGD